MRELKGKLKSLCLFLGLLSSYAAFMSSQQQQQQLQQQQQQQSSKLFPPLRLFPSQSLSLESLYRSPIQSTFLSNTSKVKNMITAVPQSHSVRLSI